MVKSAFEAVDSAGAATKIIAIGAKLVLILTLYLAWALPSAWADGPVNRVAVLPLYQQECASCHLAYPVGMLPAASWKRLMVGLDKHFGSDASLDAAAVHELSVWLQANAGTYKRVKEEPPQDRITKADWFVRKHREVDSQIWKQTAVKSAANCAACHTAAERGSYRESEIQFPQGLDARFRRGWSQ